MVAQTTSSITTSTTISSTTTAETTTTATTTAATTTAATTTAATTTAIEKTTTADTSATTNDTYNTTGTDSTDTTNTTSTTTSTTTTTDDPDTDSATTLWNTPGPLNNTTEHSDHSTNTTEHSDHSTTSETQRKLPADLVGGMVGGVGFIVIGLVVVVMVQCYFISRYVIRKNPIYACPRNLPLQSQESFHCIDIDDMADYATIDDESDEAEPIEIKGQVKLTKNPSYSSLSLSATYLAHINSRLAQSTPNLASTGSKPAKLAHSASNLVLSYHARPYNTTSELTDASSRGGYTTSHESSRGGLATTVAKREDLEESYEHEYY